MIILLHPHHSTQEMPNPLSKSSHHHHTPQVFIFITFFNQDTKKSILASNRPDHTSHSHPIPFIFEQSLCRPLRGMEVALPSMKLKERCTLHIKPSFAFMHPDCPLLPPPGLDTNKDIDIDIQLIHHIPCDQQDIVACPCDIDPAPTHATLEKHTHGNQQKGRIIKKIVQQGSGWEVPRQPFHITANISINYPSADGIPLCGTVCIPEQSVECDIGSGKLPLGIESALCTMKRGEEALVWCPLHLACSFSTQNDAAANKRKRSTNKKVIDTTVLSYLEERSSQSLPLQQWMSMTMQYVEVRIRLIDFLHVRDLTGDGGATKRTVKKGDGEFPSDCPMEDTIVTALIKVRQAQYTDDDDAAESGVSTSSSVTHTRAMWMPYIVRDELRSNGNSNIVDGSSIIQTGCGQAPAAVEAALRLMLQNETCRVISNWEYSFLDRMDVPSQFDPGNDIEFEITLLDFEKERHWSSLSGDEKLERAEMWRNQGNMLFKVGKYGLARKKYQKSLYCVNQTMEIDTEEQMKRANNAKIAVFLNLAACAQREELFGECISWCDKAIEYVDAAFKGIYRISLLEPLLCSCVYIFLCLIIICSMQGG